MVVDYSLKINDYVVTYEEETKKEGILKEQPTGEYKIYQLGQEITFDAGDGITRTWNVLKASNSNESTVELMLNENLGNPVSWNDTGENTGQPITAMNYLKEQTKDWNNVANIRLISYEEAENLGCNLKAEKTCPNWFLANTGCNDEEFKTSPVTFTSTWHNLGYWTSKYYGVINLTKKSGAYYVRAGAYFDVSNIDSEIGIRPVITVSKNMIFK